MQEDDLPSHPFDTSAPSITTRALDNTNLLSGNYWGELRTFLCVAKAGSLSRAAELLGSSHATVGREIRRLQDQIGSQLVILTKHGALLTQKGQALTDELLRLDQRLFSIASDLRAEKGEAEGAVRLGITDGLGIFFLVPELRRFSARYPKIQVQVKSPGHFKNLHENQTDVMLGYQSAFGLAPLHSRGRPVLRRAHGRSDTGQCARSCLYRFGSLFRKGHMGFLACPNFARNYRALLR
jgi:DNA-binding transcriptional LysR family regulator